MKLSSPAFQNNQLIPSKYTCDGDNISLPLEISEVPANTLSLVLINNDPDAPGGDWVHWLVWNIEPATKDLAENSVPTGAVEGITSFGRPGYGGPCPPSGTHRYFFKLYALDIKLDISTNSNKASLEAMMKNHILGQAELIGLYGRK